MDAIADADDKVAVYRNWVVLIKGNLVDIFERNGKATNRRLNTARNDLAPDGRPWSWPDAASCWCAMSGTLMTTDAVLDAEPRNFDSASIGRCNIGQYATNRATHQRNHRKAGSTALIVPM